MKKKIATAALALCMLLLSALGLTGCAAEDTLVLRVYNWEDYISEPTENEDGTVEDDYVDLIAEFEAAYYEETGTRVRVEYSTFGTNENMYNELKINPGSYDLVCPSDYMIMKMISEDMVEKFSDDFLTDSNYAKYASPYIKDLFEANYATVNGENHYWSDYSVPYMWGTMGYVYNPELSETVGEDLSSWAGLWNAEYSSVATIKDSVRDSYFLGVAVAYREELMQLKEQYGIDEYTRLDDPNYAAYNAEVTKIMNRTDADTLEKTKDALLGLKENLYGFEVDSGKQDMVAGRISINFAWSGDAVYTMDDAEPYTDENGRYHEGIYLNYVVPEECSNIWFDGWVMPKGANTELAEAFIDFLSEPENAVANMNFIGYTSAIAGDRVFEEMVDWYSEGETGETDENGNPLVPYDLNYFFNGTSDGAYRDGDFIIYVSEESAKRQIYAQYPTEEVLVRSAIMQHFDDDVNAAVNEMWEEVKGLPIPVWAYVVIAVIAAGIAVIALSYVYKGKRREPKPKKGYRAAR